MRNWDALFFMVGFVLMCAVLVGYFHAFSNKHVDGITATYLSVGVKDVEACNEWAFHASSEPEGYNPFLAYKTWNKFHGNIFLIEPEDRIQETFYSIGLACQRRGL